MITTKAKLKPRLKNGTFTSYMPIQSKPRKRKSPKLTVLDLKFEISVAIMNFTAGSLLGFALARYMLLMHY